MAWPKKHYIRKKESKVYLYNELRVAAAADGDCVNIKIIYSTEKTTKKLVKFN